MHSKWSRPDLTFIRKFMMHVYHIQFKNNSKTVSTKHACMMKLNSLFHFSGCKILDKFIMVDFSLLCFASVLKTHLLCLLHYPPIWNGEIMA